MTPALRFSEFQKNEDWEPTTIGELGKFYYGKSAPKWSLSEDAPTPCVRYGELYTKFGTVIKEIFSRTNIEPSNLRFSKGGEILIPRVGEDPYEFSKCSYLPFPNIAIGEMISVFETDEDPIFYAYYFSTLTKQFAKVVEGQNVKNLYYVNLEPIAVGKPLELAEQQKIASCLSSLDELIAAHNEKLEVLKDHKKGLMQNLFPQEGEKVPKFRFKEFEKDGEWVEKKLGEMGEFLGGGTPSRTVKDYWVGNIPWISSSDINEDDIHNISITQFINQNAIKESATKIIPKESVLFVSRVGVGKLAINDKIELCTSQDFTNFIPTNVYNYYIAYYFLANKNLLQALSQGTSIKGFSKSDLEDFKLLLPVNIKEQKKIAFCLSSLDEQITAQIEKTEKLKQHKKGLMQGLFPKVES